MVVDGINESGRKGRNPCVSTRVDLGVKNEQADAGRDGRVCLSRSKSQTRTWTGKKTHFLFN